MKKVSLRFYNDREVRAVWSEEENKWFFSVLDVIGAINEQDDYAKTRNYWKFLKTKLKKESSEVVSVTNQLKLLAPDGKRRLTDVLGIKGTWDQRDRYLIHPHNSNGAIHSAVTMMSISHISMLMT